MADNSPYNQDIPPDNQDISPDTIQDTFTNSEMSEKIAISQLLQKYSIGRAQLYDRMKYLQITTYKESGKAYLYPDQIVYMDGLHEHIKETGRMDGYPVPDPSGPVEQVQEESQPAGLVVAQTQQMAAPTYSAKGKRSQTKEQVDDVASIVRSAQGKAAGTLIAENLL
ncbi:hypothetical protein, partial [Aetokthonos hydrillicola]